MVQFLKLRHKMKITKEDIKTRFDEYNKKYFNGVLPSCKYHIFKSSSFFGRYTYSVNRKINVGHIWIAYNADWHEEDLREVIIHEMIHHYVQMIEGHKGGLFGHNWRFQRQSKRLKEEYGIIIHIKYPHLYHIGEKKPTNFFQKIRRYIGI